MSALFGVVPQATLTGTNQAKIAAVRALIPDPDAPHGSGAIQGGNGYLDQMSPGAAAQLHAELIALEASVTNV